MNNCPKTFLNQLLKEDYTKYTIQLIVHANDLNNIY